MRVNPWLNACVFITPPIARLAHPSASIGGRDATAYRPDVDGLRALAVWSVVAGHFGVPFVPGGFVGVDVFFVISGYLIGGIVWRDVRAGRFSFGAFYARRARRILPALAAVLLASGAAAWALLTPDEMIRFSRDAAATILAVSNVRFWLSESYFSPAAVFDPLLMTWSLGVEEQFYLLFPVAMLLLARLRGSRALAILAAGCMASLALSVWLTHASPASAFYLLPTRAWELGSGALLALREVEGDPDASKMPAILRDLCGWAGLALLAAAILGFDAGTPFPGVAAILPVGGTALVILGREGFANRRLLGARPTVFVGLISYSWYLWHWPLLSFARIATDASLGTAASGALALVSFAAAVLSWRFVERPFRTPGLLDSCTLRRFGGAAAALLAAALLMSAEGGWRDRFGPGLEVVAAQARALQGDPCLAGYGAASPDRSPGCVAPEDGRPSVALLGDSHAAALAGALREAAKARGLAFVQLTKSSCPALADVTRRMPDRPAHEGECATFEAEALRIVRRRPAVRAVVLAGFWSAPFQGEAAGARYVAAGDEGRGSSAADSRDSFRRGLDGVLEALAAPGRRIVLVQDVPAFDFDPLRRLEAALIPARRALADASGDAVGDPDLAPLRSVRFDEARGAVAEIAARRPDVDLIDPWPLLCDANQCRVGEAQQLYYIDPQHLSAAGARKVLSGLSLPP